MAELEIGQKDTNIGDKFIGGDKMLFETTTKSFGDIKLKQTNKNTFVLTINGVTETIVSPNRVGHA